MYCKKTYDTNKQVNNVNERISSLSLSFYSECVALSGIYVVFLVLVNFICSLDRDVFLLLQKYAWNLIFFLSFNIFRIFFLIFFTDMSPHQKIPHCHFIKFFYWHFLLFFLLFTHQSAYSSLFFELEGVSPLFIYLLHFHPHIFISFLILSSHEVLTQKNQQNMTKRKIKNNFLTRKQKKQLLRGSSFQSKSDLIENAYIAIKSYTDSCQ